MSRKVLVVNNLLHSGRLEVNIPTIIFTDSINDIQREKVGISVRTYSNKFLVDKILMYNGRPSQYLQEEFSGTSIHGELRECAWVDVKDYINNIIDFIRHDEG